MSRRSPDDDAPAPHDIPLVRRFPGLARVPRVALGNYPTPVEPLASIAPSMWIKRDDLAGAPMGGNKLRALEFLLAGVEPGDRIVTVGSAGSTHALAVATYGARLGARVLVGRWRQEMNATADRVARLLPRTAERAPVFRSPALAFLWAFGQRARGARWIAAGGSAPLGVLGHVNAGLELVEQIDAGVIPAPATVVVPLGTGGTAVGLALAFAIANRSITVVGARVVPRVVARRSHLRRLARRTSYLIENETGASVPRVRDDRLVIAHDAYGGAYGRETTESRDAADRLRDAGGVALDATYSAKAFTIALRQAARGPTLFWLTFDSRILDEP